MAETWTDNELAEFQQRCLEGWGDIFPVAEREARMLNSELYRLARLGLAAEAVGRQAFADSPDYSCTGFPAFHSFVDSPAWTR